MNRGSTFVLPVVGSAGLWIYAGTPYSFAGLVLGELLALAFWPLFVLSLAVGVPYWLALLVPRKWRADYRNRRDRYGRLKHPRGSRASSRFEAWLVRTIYAADRHRCLYCGREPLGLRELHIDHRIPDSWGGLTLLPNLFLLCSEHNLMKMTFWIDRRGVEHGRTSDPETAAEIFYKEGRARWNPVRWWRIAWAMS